MDNTQDSEITQYLTEEHCAAAAALGLTVSLHMVKPMACSDPGNLDNIRMLCTKYPGMKLILCHSARGFNMHHVINSIDSLADLPNLYFDTGAVTEAGATNAIIRAFGPKKVMCTSAQPRPIRLVHAAKHHRLLACCADGSDWPVAEARGKCISLGDSFIWLTPHNVDLFGKHSRDDIVSPALVGFETLRALKQACEELSLSRDDIEDIFWCAPLAAAVKRPAERVCGGAQEQRGAAVRRAARGVPRGAPGAAGGAGAGPGCAGGVLPPQPERGDAHRLRHQPAVSACVRVGSRRVCCCCQRGSCIVCSDWHAPAHSRFA